METGEGVVLVKGRATIDTRPPFRSVKEAVALFGERVLVGEIYAKQLKEMQPKETQDKGHVTSAVGTVSAELEEAKQNLQKAREEEENIASCLKSLKEELDETKRELRHLKAAKHVVMSEQPKTINPEIEDFSSDHGIYQHEPQNKKFVTFASPPSLTREIIHSHPDDGAAPKLGRTPSFRKEGKKKPVVNPIIGWLFPRKKKGYGAGFDPSLNA